MHDTAPYDEEHARCIGQTADARTGQALGQCDHRGRARCRSASLRPKSPQSYNTRSAKKRDAPNFGRRRRSRIVAVMMADSIAAATGANRRPALTSGSVTSQAVPEDKVPADTTDAIGRHAAIAVGAGPLPFARSVVAGTVGGRRSVTVTVTRMPDINVGRRCGNGRTCCQGRTVTITADVSF